MHDIPIRFRNKRMAEKICETIGKVNVMSNENKSEGDEFIRIRVTIDISKPLCRGRVISLDSGNLNLKSMNLREKRSADEIFEERIEEIDTQTPRAQQPQFSMPLPHVPLSAIYVNTIQTTERHATWKRVIKKIQSCGEALSKWSKKSFGSVRRELKEKRKLLSKAELAARKGGDVT
ncbi:hypothetical protein SO802_017678 [Lithocarpus litseifolius]|uniref:Uncharacterized protein n=1 Tax=Lithocarpus litseifolius TaxID=425828 RepID=A0AAW2CIQ6_9ROSI